MGKNDEKWLANNEALKAYIENHHHLPPKDAPLGAKYLLNWMKYQRKRIKAGLVSEEQKGPKDIWKGVGIYHLTFNVAGKRALLGELVAEYPNVSRPFYRELTKRVPAVNGLGGTAPSLMPRSSKSRRRVATTKRRSASI